MGNAETKEGSYGYRIMKVAPGSPAQQAGLIEFLDFIIDLSSEKEHAPFTGNYTDFFKIVQNCEDQQATMKVYNMLYRKTRVITIVPSRKWETSDSLLGALVRYEEYATAHERVLRISEVYPNSPAALSGMQPRVDYILGTPQYLYTDLNELANFIEMTQEKETVKSLEIYLFSSQTNSVRSTLILPNRNWGGKGLLGCEFGLGILNYLPQLDDNIFVSTLLENPIETLDQPENEKIDIVKSNDNTPKATPNQETPESRLRPPTDSEIHQAHPDDEKKNHELNNDRIRLLHLSHQHPPHATKPVIKSGRSTANPFHIPKQDDQDHQDDLVDSLNPAQRKRTLDLTAEDESLNTTIPASKSVPDFPSDSHDEPKINGHNTNSTSPPRKESQPKEIEEPRKSSVSLDNQEKSLCKTSIEYNFFSKKLNKDYKIISTHLFNIDEISNSK